MATTTTESAPFLINEGANVSDYGDGNIARVLKTYRAQFEGGIHEPSGNQIVTSSGNRDYTLAREAFVDEVRMIWKISGEKLVPGNEHDQTVFVGRWKRRPGNNGIYVRVTEDSIALARDLSLGFREAPGGWFYEWGKTRHGNPEGRMETKGQIPLAEIVQAAGLCTEFEEALERNLPHYA